MIAAIQTWHPHHSRAFAEFQRRLAVGEDLVLVAHSLLECYSVLTRLPLPHRMTADAAWASIDDLFVQRGTVVAPTARDVVAMLPRLAAAGISGGQVFDAAIAQAASQARADLLLTFNTRHFRATAGTLEVREPGSG